MKNSSFLIVSIMSTMIWYSCGEQNTNTNTDVNESAFVFPTDSNSIKAWIVADDANALYTHTWQVWNMMNQKTDQVQEGDTLRDWMTWQSPSQIINKQSPDSRLIGLEKPRQFHAKSLAELDPSFYVTVQYNPPAAKFIGTNDYLSGSTLQGLLDAGQTTIKDFPNDAIVIKPIFYVASKDVRYAKMPIWKGPPVQPGPFPSNEWNSYVYVDLENQSPASKTTCDSTDSNYQDKCAYNLDDFVHYRLTADEVKQVENEGGHNIQEGDYAILVGMHMTTKEIKRWTWQTFYWAADPDQPPFPSSAEVAKNRTFIQDKAVAHYATTVAYQMLKPVQPYTGGDIIGEPVYAFNPYLEAPFDFGADKALRLPGYVISGKKTIVNKFGVQSNCMSCHATAHYFKTDTIDNDFYVSDTYVDMAQGKVITNISGTQRDSILVFVDKLKTDFLWSVPDVANGNQN